MRTQTPDEWQMRDDARTLAEANEIMSDRQRHANAVKMAKKMAVEEDKRQRSMKKVAGMKITGNEVKSTTERVNDAFRASIARATR